MNKELNDSFNRKMNKELNDSFNNLSSLYGSLFNLYHVTKDERLKQFDKLLEDLNNLLIELDLKRIDNDE